MLSQSNELPEGHKEHELKDKWYGFYCPPHGDKNGQRDLGWVTSIEQLFAMINAFPPLHLLPLKNHLAFGRDRIEPKFENFPDGGRILVFTKTVAQHEAIVPRVLAAVMGEDLSSKNPSCVPDLVRMTHAKVRSHNDGVKIEVWFKKIEDKETLLQYFSNLANSTPGVEVTHTDFK